MTRVTGSLVTNQVRAYDLLRMFSRNGRPTPLGQAFAEYGRIDKTLHLLDILDPIDGGYRRTLNKQLTVQEARQGLARKICHGGNRQIRQAYRDGQEDQLAALGLVVNAVTLWNSRYLSAAVDRLCAQGIPVKDEDAARLSPLGHAHINCQGRYAIAFSAPAETLCELGDIPVFPAPTARRQGAERKLPQPTGQGRTVIRRPRRRRPGPGTRPGRPRSTRAHRHRS
ncbi:Tn3 family transposase [Spirillospora sp. NPDC029432]|uniref:Tn3 family transposase n=1 Tax=Spirillospora sp. NPDC029432 TaxID=3154599 RepID=UPI0034546DE9